MKLLRSRCLAVLPQVDFSVFPPKGGKERHLSGFLRLAATLAALCLGSAGAWAATCTVSSTADTNTSGTLRYCLNNFSSGDTIDLTGVSGTITLASALPAIAKSVTITGPGANQLTISGGGSFRVFNITGTATVNISGLKFSGGNVALSGGAINQGGGSLTVNACEFANNSSTGATSFGGAIDAGGSLTVSNSTFTSNSSTMGGAIYASGGLTLWNSTFFGNTSVGVGGAVAASGTIAITNNTFSGNTGGSGEVYILSGGTATIANNLFANNGGTSAIDDSANGASASYNVFYNNGGADCANCHANSNALDATANPLAAPLTYYGGTTKTFLPQPGSQAICAGSTSLATGAGLTADQRGFALDPSYTPCTPGQVDAGAVQTNYIQVQASGDAGFGASDCQGTNCTLRDAIALANSNGYGDIGFKSGVSSITLGSTGKLELSGTTGINIIGGFGSGAITVNGGGSTSNFSVFTVDSGVPALLYGLTISNGNTNTNGGGINNAGTLTLVDSTISGNTAVNGGGIANSGTLQIAESTIAANSAASTSSSAYGGGIYNSAGSVATVNTTVAGNSASGTPTDDGGGFYVTGGTAHLSNSIVSANSTVNGPDANFGANGGSFTLDSGNVAGGNTNATSNLAGGTGAPILPVNGGGAPVLQLNGIGATIQTIVPLPGSPAICAGLSSNIPSGLSTDERGYPLQPTGGYCTATEVDAGAVQTNYTSVNFVQQPSNVALGTAMSPAPTVNVLETDTLLSSSNTDAVNGISITLAYSGKGTVSGNNATTTGGVATFSSLKVSTRPGINVTLGASVPVVGATTLSATSNSFDVIGPATVLHISAPGSITVGVPFSVTVTAYDAAGNIATGYAGTIHFTSSDPGTALVLPGNYTFVPATDHGVHAFTNGVTLVTAPSQTVTATDTVTNTITALEPVTVNKETPTVLMTAAGAAINVDGSVTFTATVSPAAASTDPVPFAGTMLFASNGTTIAACSTQTVNATTGVATCTTTALLAGPDAITATYSGDSNYNASLASPSTTQTVNKEGTTVTMTAAGAAINVDGSVTFTATVAPNAGSASVSFAGTMLFASKGTTIAACSTQTVNATTGVATCTTTTLLAGSDAITATYSGDSNYIASPASASTTQTVNQESTTVTMTAAGAAINVDGSVTFTATVAPNAGSASVPFNGTMLFASKGTTIAACSTQTVNATTGVATCTTTTLLAGSDAITATYSGDSNYIASPASASTTQTVNKANTSIGLSPASQTANLNQQVTFTATVTAPGNGVALSGQVVFTDNSTPIAACGGSTGVTVTWNSGSSTGTAVCTTSSLSAGGHSILANYGNDSNYNNSGPAAATATISGVSGSVPLVLSPSGSSTVNQAVTITATVSYTSPTLLTGTMAFTDNGAAVPGCTVSFNKTATASTGVATCTTQSLPLGSNAIVATYSGDPNYTPSPGSVTYTVNQTGTSLVLASVPASTAGVNQTVTFTATVTINQSGPTMPGGSVTFKDSVTSAAIPNCSALALASASATTFTAGCATTTLALGGHTITATYSGDTNFAASSSTSPITINQSGTSTALISSQPAGATVNQAVTFTATVTENTSGGTALNGTVAFTDNGITITNCSAIAPSSVGVAVCTDSALTAAGSPHTIVATYAHDTNFAGSSNSLTQTVNQGTTTLALVSSAVANTSTINQSVTFTATVTPSPLGANVLASSGIVTFTDNGNPISAGSGVSCGTNGVVPINWNASASTGTAACTTPALIVGSHTIKATYTLDPNFSGSINSITQIVNTATTNLSLTPFSSTFTVNTQVPLLATFTPPNGAPTPTGKVTFTDTSATPAAVLCSSVTPTLPAGSTLYQASCPVSTLTASTHVILAAYAGDMNFSIGSATTSISMTPATSSTTVTIQSPATVVTSAGNQSGLEEAVKFQATVTPTSGPVLLSGTMAFTVNGTAIIGCTAAAVNPATGIATCAATTANPGFADGPNVIGAIYTDQNYTNTTITATQTVEDYTIAVAPIPTGPPAAIFLTAGYATGSTQGYPTGNTTSAPVDPFTGQAINIVPTSISGFTGTPKITCAATASSPSTGTAPVCDLAATTLVVANGTTQTPVALVIDATSATAGTYTFTVTATDATSSIVRKNTNTFTVVVRAKSSTLVVTSGATTNNVGNVTFQLPANVSLSNFICPSVSGTGLTGFVPASELGIACTFSPTTVLSSTSAQTATVTVTLTTTGTVTAQNTVPRMGSASKLLVAALFGAPVFLLLGFRRSRKTFLSNLARMVAIAVIAMSALYSVGCGGSFSSKTSTTAVTGGTTPPGTYYLLIQGTGSDGNTYQAVLPVDVNL